MNDSHLTEKLALLLLGWKAAPGRFIKANRAWTPKWRFAPLTNLEDAFALLDASASTYTLAADKHGNFKAEVRLGARVGKASGESKPRAITLALAAALGLEIPDETAGRVSLPRHRRGPSSRSKISGI